MVVFSYLFSKFIYFGHWIYIHLAGRVCCNKGCPFYDNCSRDLSGRYFDYESFRTCNPFNRFGKTPPFI